MEFQPTSLEAVALPSGPQEPALEMQPEADGHSTAHSAVAHSSHQPPRPDDQGAVPIPASFVIQPTPATDVQPPNHNRSLPSPAIASPHLTPSQGLLPHLSNCPASPQSCSGSSDLSDLDPELFPIDCDLDGPAGHQVLRLKPTVDQWNDFPAMLAFARSRRADDDGCFKIILPLELQEPLPEKSSHKVPANAYRPNQIKKNSFWRVNTVPSLGTFASSVLGPECTTSAAEAVDNLRKMFRKNDRKQIRNVRYRVDVPAWTPDQRRAAGVPERSPIHPLKGDKLDHTRAIIPGIHTPYVYESGPHFGASFQIHAEDFRLVSLNHLYKGRKIWIVVPSTAVNVAEEALGRRDRCSQFMRHRAEFFFPQKLTKLGIPFRIVDQRPGETIVILPDAYHEGFSTGYTIAEAKNYADAAWTTDTYQPCETSCQLVTAIPADLMRPLGEGESRLDLCTGYDAVVMPEPAKRRMEDEDEDNRDIKRIKE
ncbi:JmjC domain, hydroxylase-domain-containing protein [Ilyonectria destructans]|nr:JmjC domain, hydroxylase-domain-containing protein [Ilyonectria destructans]